MQADRSTLAPSSSAHWEWDDAHRDLRVAVVGATGAVGRELVALMLAHGHAPERIDCFARRSQHIELPSQRSLTARALGDLAQFAAQASRSEWQLCFLCTPADVSLSMGPALAERGLCVIDLSSAHRLQRAVPLVVPEINAHALVGNARLFANPNCTTAIAALPLAVLEREAGLEEVVLVSFQAASGAGLAGLATLHAELRAAVGASTHVSSPGGSAAPTEASPFAAPLALNVIPAVAEVDASGTSGEERKVMDELRRILGRAELQVDVTTTRVPVERCHSVAVHVKLARPLTAAAARDLMRRAPGISATDDPHGPRPRECAGTDPVHVGRIRSGSRGARSLCFFAVGDQLRKGAALNALQIAAALPARSFRDVAHVASS